MEVYGPTKNSILALKEANPAYFALCVSRSEYSESEINQVLVNIELANTNLQAFLSQAYDLLVFENGLEMNYIPNGFASKAHENLSNMLSETSYISPSMSQNDHSNCFPVRKWEKEIDYLNKRIAKIQKFIAKEI